jgi:hypothetical protein
MVASFEGEREYFGGWLKDNYMGEGGLERFAEEVAPILGLGADDAALAAMMGMNQELFNQAIVSYDLALERTVAAVSQDDLGAAREEVQRIQEDVEAGLYGPLAPMVLPALEKCLESFIKGYQQFDSTIEKLEELKNDPTAQDREGAVETHATDHATVPLTEAQLIIDLVIEASQIEKCDFDLDKTWQYEGLLLALPHLDGMRDLARLMSAASEEAGEAVPARIAAIFRMANHLGMDAQLRSTNAAVEIAATCGTRHPHTQRIANI